MKRAFLYLSCAMMSLAADPPDRTLVREVDFKDLTYQLFAPEKGRLYLFIGQFGCSGYAVSIINQKEDALTFKVTEKFGAPRDLDGGYHTSRFANASTADITNKTFTIFHKGNRVTKIEEVK